MTTKTKKVLADLLLLSTAVIWGGGFIAVKTSLDTVTPLYMIAFRFLIASGAVCLLFCKRIPQLKLETIKYGVIPGVFMFLAFLFQTIGMKYTTASKNAFLTAVNVIIVPFVYWVIKKKMPRVKNIAAAAISLVGVGLLTLGKGDAGMNLGDLLTLICSAFYALHIVSVGILSKKYNPIDLTLIQMVTAAILGVISALIFEPFPTGIDQTAVGGVLYLGLVSTFLAFLFQNLGQKYTSSSHASILLCLESPFGCIFSVIFLSERLTPQMLMGCVIILFAVLLSESSLQFLKRKRETDMSSDEVVGNADGNTLAPLDGGTIREQR